MYIDMKNFKILSLAIALVCSFSVFASDEINTTFLGNKAVKGYDVVSYFVDNTAVKGTKTISTKYMGANYWFSTIENKKLFLKSPEKYLPQFGGYCAYAVGAKNTTADINPTQFSVIGGKLYLNYNKKIQKMWVEKRDEYIKIGHNNWTELLEELKD